MCNPRTREAEAGGTTIQGWPGLDSEFQASQEFITRLCQKKEGKGKKEGRRGAGRRRERRRKRRRRQNKKEKEKRIKNSKSHTYYQME